jgi:type I restriction enzyme M protein
MSYNIKDIKKEFKTKGIFYTQPQLAEYIKSLIDVPITNVYDPTCGDGALLSCFPDDLPKFGQELNDHQLNIASQRLKNFVGVCADTLIEPAFLDKKFSCIVANPPFSIKWNPPVGLFKDERFNNAPTLPPQSKADYAFLMHIMYLLSDDGVAIVLNFPGVLYRGYNEGILRRWFVENNWIEKVIQIPGKTFIDTTISTALLVLKKNKTNTDIEFIDNELKLSRTVSFDEIAANNFSLSVSGYVQKPTIQEVIDSADLNKQCRLSMLRMLRKDIQVDKMICELEGWDWNSYLDELKSLIDQYYKTTQPVTK